MDQKRMQRKLNVLAAAARYDVSCSSSGSTRRNQGGLGNGHASGICHSFTEDGRCISLLKILMTNYCIYDCAYCVCRTSNDLERQTFTPEEIVDLTLNFYRRNYIEGLFLSSGVLKNPDYTMERLIAVAKTLRETHRFQGYIHLKGIPKASSLLLDQASLYADRLSLNMEIPTASGLALLAPQKKHEDMLEPMSFLKEKIHVLKDMRKKRCQPRTHACAGQSSQLIVGAAQETDHQIIQVSSGLYKHYELRRVYYSGYVPMVSDKRLPPTGYEVPLVRENRLYQADWLMRFYHFQAEEIVSTTDPFLDLEVDPKLAWALRNRSYFPVPVQRAPLEMILRIPGVGRIAAQRIVKARRFGHLTLEHLKTMGVVISRAQYFVALEGANPFLTALTGEGLRRLLVSKKKPLASIPQHPPLFVE